MHARGLIAVRDCKQAWHLSRGGAGLNRTRSARDRRAELTSIRPSGTRRSRRPPKTSRSKGLLRSVQASRRSELKRSPPAQKRAELGSSRSVNHALDLRSYIWWEP